MAVNIFKLTGEIEVNTGKADAGLKRIEQDAKRTQASLGHLDSAGKKAGQGIASGFSHSSSSAARLGREISDLKNKLSSMKAPSLNFGSASGGGGGFNISSLVKGNLITSALSAATGGLTDAMKQGWSAGIEYNKMLEKASISFTTLLGSTTKAQEHLKALQAFGESTPFEFPDLVKASQRMQAMGFAAQDVIPTLKNVGDAVSAVGGGKEELDGVVLALGQMQTKGKVSAEEMNQLAERGIPAWDLLAKAIGKTKAETIKLSESGRLNGGRAVQGITAMMGERFGGQMDKMSGTLEGRESNFNDILNRRLGEATKGNTDQLKNAYAKGTEGLATSAGEGFAKRLDELMTKMGADVAPILQKFASGEYFMQGISSINFGEKAVQSFNEGDAKGLITNSAQALGLKKGAAGEDQIAGAVADSLKAKPIFSEGIDRMLIQGITGALQKTEQAARAAGALVGIGTGEGIETGVRNQLDMHSPSRVMEGLGHDAIEGFAIGFEAGKKGVSRSPIDIEKMRAALIADLEKLREDPRIKAMLDTIAKAEGTGGAYNMQFGGGRFSDMSDHPGEAITRKMGGKSITSTAAGRYQFLNRTWSGLESQLGLKDFSAKSQDLGAIQLMKQRGMIDPIMKGDISGALTKGNREWASLPGSPYGQPTKSAETLTTAYNAALEKYNGLMGNTSGLLAQMNSLYDQAAAKLSTLAEQAKAFVGLGTTAPIPAAATPKAIQQAQTVQGGQLATATTTAKADILTLSKDAASATVAMSVPLKEVAPAAATATEALKSTASQAGMFADAITETGKAASEAIDHMAHFKDAFASGFDNMFDDILDGKKVSLKDFGKQLFKGGLSSVISSATGGQASSPGGMLSNMLFGGARGGAGNAGGGGSFPSTGGFAGGGGASDILDKAQGVGSMFQKGGALSKLPGLGKVGGFLGKIPGLSKLGSLLGFGGGGAGAAAGAAGATGGASGASGVLAAAGGPVGMAIALGATVAMPLLSKLFSKDPLKDYKKHIKAEYGIDASKQMLQKVFEIGQSKFGKDAPKRQIETVRLPEVRDMLSEYSGAFMKGGNAKLFDSKIFGDQFSAVNQFKVGMRANGGPVTAGMPYIVGERRAELFVPSSNGRIMPSVEGRGGGGMFGKGKEEILAILAKVAESLDRFQSMPADHVVMTGLKARPGMAAADVVNSFATRDEHSQKIRHMSAKR